MKKEGKQAQQCPYCGARVIQVPVRGKYVNGLKAVQGQGCEFCNPTPLDAHRRVDSRLAA
jgi:DNA-directed RNA polymerase subunit RPC12/RpoP